MFTCCFFNSGDILTSLTICYRIFTVLLPNGIIFLVRSQNYSEIGILCVLNYPQRTHSLGTCFGFDVREGIGF
jgi:hypothetical protein